MPKKTVDAHSIEQIMVIDNDPDLRESLDMSLLSMGYHVHLHEGGLSALAELEEFGLDHVDMIICDLNMPGMTGAEFVREFMDLPGSRPPVLAMSAYADLKAALEMISLGAEDFLSKPFVLEELQFKIARAEEIGRLRAIGGVTYEHVSFDSVRTTQLEEGQAAVFDEIVAKSPVMLAFFSVIEKVAPHKATVLLMGESGTGKELVARAIHQNSPRSSQRFLALNCGAIPPNLLESELFGHMRGAFTGAINDRKGYFEMANGGTLFLDEIGELPLELQVKLLRVLQEEQFTPVGGTREMKTNVRIVAATIKDLESEVEQGAFREDLFYRLNVVPMKLPPLRERMGDVSVLAQHFLKVQMKRHGVSVAEITPEALRLLSKHRWPGNVRELQNVIERAMLLSADGQKIASTDLPTEIQDNNDPLIQGMLDPSEFSIKKMNDLMEETLIRRALEHTGGNRTKAAKLLEISHRALLYKIKGYDIDL